MFGFTCDNALVDAGEVFNKVAHELHKDVVHHGQEALFDPLKAPYLVRGIQLVKRILQHTIDLAIEVHIIRNLLSQELGILEKPQPRNIIHQQSHLAFQLLLPWAQSFPTRPHITVINPELLPVRDEFDVTVVLLQLFDNMWHVVVDKGLVGIGYCLQERPRYGL